MRRRRSSFKFPRPVSVDNGRTLSIPIIDRQVPAQRLALYQADTAARNPMAAVRLTNDGDTGLPPGILTIYERDKAGYVAYVGDARLSGFPVGETRLLAYALDEKITVERDAAQTERHRHRHDRAAACCATRACIRQTVDLSRARAGQGAAPADRRAAPACRAGPWSSPTPRASSSARATTAFRSSCRAATQTQTFEVVQEQTQQQELRLVDGAGRPDPGLCPGARVRCQDARGADRTSAAPGRRRATPSAR